MHLLICSSSYFHIIYNSTLFLGLIKKLQSAIIIIYNFFSDIACSVAGITSDANVLTNELRAIAQRHTLQFGEPMPVEQLVIRLCDIKQAYTQYGGKNDLDSVGLDRYFLKICFFFTLVMMVKDFLGQKPSQRLQMKSSLHFCAHINLSTQR